MSKTIADLREALFDTIEKVKAGQIQPDQARQITDLAQVIVNSAKVEVDAARLLGSRETVPFLEPVSAPPPPGITGVTRHRLQG